MSTLLVTGGGGFVMSHLVRQWVDTAPQNRALVLDAAPLDNDARQFLSGERIHFTQGSVTDRAAWDALPQLQSITHLVHGAAVTSIQRHVTAHGLQGALPALSVNIMGGRRGSRLCGSPPGTPAFCQSFVRFGLRQPRPSGHWTTVAGRRQCRSGRLVCPDETVGRTADR